MILTLSSPNARRKDTYALVISFRREFLLPEMVCKGFFVVVNIYILGNKQLERQAWRVAVSGRIEFQVQTLASPCRSHF